jgi:hypothetical protein
MLTREAVFPAKIQVAIFTMERKIYPLTAEGTVLMNRGGFLPG